MRLSRGQRNTVALVEKRLGHGIGPRLLRPFFAKTDRGEDVAVGVGNAQEFQRVLFAFKTVALDYAMWVEDFREGLLFPLDFEDEDAPTRNLAWRAFKAAFKKGGGANGSKGIGTPGAE